MAAEGGWSRVRAGNSGACGPGLLDFIFRGRARLYPAPTAVLSRPPLSEGEDFSVRIVWLLGLFSLLDWDCFSAFSRSFSALRSVQLSKSAGTKWNRGCRIPAAHANEKVVARKSETQKAAASTITAPAGFNDASSSSARTIPNNPPAGRYPRTGGRTGAIESETDSVKSIKIIPDRQTLRLSTRHDASQ